MTLPFSTQLNGKPTYFVEKILHSLHYDLKQGSVLNQFLQVEKMVYKTKNELIDTIRVVESKKHTIREDKSNRWKAGNDIHFVINNRTPERFQFAPVVKCVSTQKIEIFYTGNQGVEIKIDNKLFYFQSKYGKTNIFHNKRINQLAINDGFESAEDFFSYFNKDFTGKIIHWTNLKYNTPWKTIMPLNEID